MSDLKPIPSLETMQSYAEAAMKAGWSAAVNAAVGGSLSGSWERDWFEKNPPESAIPEDEWASLSDDEGE